MQKLLKSIYWHKVTATFYGPQCIYIEYTYVYIRCIWHYFIFIAQYCRPTLRARYALVTDVCLSVDLVRCPSHGHISKTKQDKPIVTMKHYWEVGTAVFVTAFRSSPVVPLGRGDYSIVGRHDRPVTPVSEISIRPQRQHSNDWFALAQQVGSLLILLS